MSLLRLFAYRRHLDEIRITVRERPAYFAKIYFLLTLFFAGLATAWWFYYRMRAAPDLDPAVFFVVVGLAGYLSALFWGAMLSWGLVRQSRKPWGVALPEERKVVFVRAGVWAGLTIGSLYSLPFLIGGLILIAAHISFGALVRGAAGFVAFVFAIRAIRELYGVRRRRYLYVFVLSPFLILALVGIVVAIAIPQWQKYERLVHAAQRPTASSAEYPSRAPSPAQLRQEDSSCSGGLPLAAPYTVRTGYFGRVVGFVSPWRALVIQFATEQQVHGLLEPTYDHDLRVTIHPRALGPLVREVAVVPVGMSVRLGQRVWVRGFRASHSFACQYRPALVVPGS